MYIIKHIDFASQSTLKREYKKFYVLPCVSIILDTQLRNYDWGMYSGYVCPIDIEFWFDWLFFEFGMTITFDKKK